MADLKIYLGQNSLGGLFAAIEADYDGDSVTLYATRYKSDPRAACIYAAIRLRELADAFDRLSVMDDQFKESTQTAAMTPAPQEAT